MGWISVPESTNFEELYHHGIKGQKWGVRRYQNPDGTLTSAGKKRYLSDKNMHNSNQINSAQQAHMQATQAAQQAHEQATQIAQQAAQQAVQDHMQATQAAQQAHMQAVQNHQMMFYTSPMMFGMKGKNKKATNKPVKLSDAEKEKIINSGDPQKLSKIANDLTMDEYRTALQRVEMNQRLKNYEELQKDETWREVEKHANRARKATNAAVFSYNTIAAINNIVNPDLQLPPINPGGGNKKKR